MPHGHTLRLGQLAWASVGALPAPAITLFTVPAGEAWLVKRVSLYGSGAVGPVVQLSIRSGTTTRGLVVIEAAPGRSAHYDGYDMLEAGQSLQAIGATTGGGHITVTGGRYVRV